jgi:hypothetical protein
MSDLMAHRGGQLVTRDALDLIPLPEQTETYVPVSHYHFANKMMALGTEILRDYVVAGETYAVARNGNQLFALLNFKKDNTEMGLSIAFRNSYDRSMSLGIAIGANVFICDNLALQGEIAVMKKHTKGVWNELEDIAIATLYKSQRNFDQVVADSETLKAIPVDNDAAFRLMGMLYGHDIIGPRQLTVVKDEWLKPSHEEFKERNKWSFLNACTEALKTTPPVAILEKHIECYNAVLETAL